MTTHTDTIRIEIAGPDKADQPVAKAAHVADLVRVYRDAVDPGEPMLITIIDLVADLLHYADVLGFDEPDAVDHDPLWLAVDYTETPGDVVADRAVDHYRYERHGEGSDR